MKEVIEDLQQRIESLEQKGFVDEWELNDLEFDISEDKQLSPNKIVCSASGSYRRWRETHIPRGATKFSNWAVTVKILDENDSLLKCDYIKLSDCNYKFKQSATAVEASQISFTTPGERGWADIKFKVTVKFQGSIYTFDMKIKM